MNAILKKLDKLTSIGLGKPKGTSNAKVAGDNLSVNFPSNGTVKLVLENVNMLKLSRGDRDFVFKLIDTMTEYQKGGNNG